MTWSVVARDPETGDAAGGDKRGRQGAALLIHTTEVYPALDLRVDDDRDSIRELRRLYEKSKTDFTPWQAIAPTEANPHGVYDVDEVDRLLARDGD